MIAHRRRSLAARFVLAMILVTLVAGATASIVGLAVAPSLFHDHLHDALPSVSTSVLQQVDAAFWSANAIGLAFALPAALLASVAAGYFLSRRLRRSARPLAIAASEVAAGRYDVRVNAHGLGTEFDELIASFNHMAMRLQRSEESRRRLLADVTHELRTPVATLAAYVEGLEDGIVALDAPTIGILKAQTTRLARLTDDMAAVSLVDEHPLTLKREKTDPGNLVRAASAAFRDQFAGKGVVLRVVVAENLPGVEVDPDRMGQVMTNLLDNALRHTARGGSVTVAAEPDGDDLQLSVADTGEGIAAENLRLIFDRFYRIDTARTRTEGRGSGIGLAIVKNLVDAHAGRVHAVSAGLGHGSTFVIRLPAAH